MENRVLVALIFGFLISGCASTISVTYYSLPSSATLFEGEGNRNLGMLPQTYQYKMSKRDKERGYAVLKPLTAMWPSGASSSVSGLRLYLNKGNNQQFTFFRPKDVSGNELDVQNAIEQKRNRIRQQEVYQQYYIEGQKIRAMKEQKRRDIDCTSTRVGDTVYTNCR